MRIPILKEGVGFYLFLTMFDSWTRIGIFLISFSVRHLDRKLWDFPSFLLCLTPKQVGIFSFWVLSYTWKVRGGMLLIFDLVWLLDKEAWGFSSFPVLTLGQEGVACSLFPLLT